MRVVLGIGPSLKVIQDPLHDRRVLDTSDYFQVAALVTGFDVDLDYAHSAVGSGYRGAAAYQDHRAAPFRPLSPKGPFSGKLRYRAARIWSVSGTVIRLPETLFSGTVVTRCIDRNKSHPNSSGSSHRKDELR